VKNEQYGTGNLSPCPPLDLAILFVPDLSKQERFNLRLSIASELSSLAGRDVDIVDMQAVPL
jgi:predicted nucleotidyltransferase